MIPEPSPVYPVDFSFDPPEKIANWRPLVNWLLAIPHFAILYGLQILSRAVGVISWFVIVFTGKLPESLANVQAMYLRYNVRTYTFAGFMREEYPPFGFDTTATDPGLDPRVRVNVRPELTDRNRLTVFFRLILVIPQAIVVFVLFARRRRGDAHRLLRRALHRALAGRHAGLRPQRLALGVAGAGVSHAAHRHVPAVRLRLRELPCVGLVSRRSRHFV